MRQGIPGSTTGRGRGTDTKVLARRPADWRILKPGGSEGSTDAETVQGQAQGGRSSRGVANPVALEIFRCRLAEFVVVERTLVSVVDDDESVRESLPDLLQELGFEARAFASAEEFLASDALGETRCLILDVAMPGLSGPELQRRLVRQGQAVPVIFITAHVDATMRRNLLAQGAIECLFKPFSEQELSSALDAAVRTVG